MKKIIHIDCDCFFAAVEMRDNPALRGVPLAVGGRADERGVLATCNYEARKFGVFTPMPTVRARRLCPKLIVVPGDFEKYERFSRWMFSYAYDFTPDVEQTSIDARASMKQADKALEQATETMKTAEAAVANIQTLSDPDSPVIYELGKSLKEVSAAARSLRSLANYLDRNPNALIFGRPGPKEN